MLYKFAKLLKQWAYFISVERGSQQIRAKSLDNQVRTRGFSFFKYWGTGSFCRAIAYYLTKQAYQLCGEKKTGI